MKKFFIFCFLMMIYAPNTAAKYVLPEGSLSREENQSQRHARYLVRQQDADGDGKLSLEEFKNRKLSREDRRLERKLRKEGKYKSPEEIFEAIDSDKAGFVTPEQMGEYYQKLQN